MSEGGGAAHRPPTRSRVRRSPAWMPPASSAMLLSLPEHLRDACGGWSRRSWPSGTPGGLVVRDGRLGDRGGTGPCRARGSRLATDLRDARLRTPTLDHSRDNRPVRKLLGNTEETLACYESAGALGAQRVVVTTGAAWRDGARGRCPRDSTLRGIPGVQRAI